MSNDSLGDRMKRYEKVSENYLIRRTPVVIRIDGKAFHTLTASLPEKFDNRLHYCMVQTMRKTCEKMQGAVLGYTQSDEISIILRDWDTIRTEAWFDYRQNKMESVAASMATAFFNDIAKSIPEFKLNMAFFDARAFNLPKEEVTNYLRWRQQDAERNSVQTYAREFFSNKELHGKSNREAITMLDNIGNSWQQLDTWKKRGTCWIGTDIRKGTIDNGRFSSVDLISGLDENIPVFTQDREYTETALMYIKEDK